MTRRSADRMLEEGIFSTITSLLLPTRTEYHGHYCKALGDPKVLGPPSAHAIDDAIWGCPTALYTWPRIEDVVPRNHKMMSPGIARSDRVVVMAMCNSISRRPFVPP